MVAAESPTTQTQCRLACLLARGSSKAVIFRRGPSKRTCLIAWNRADDTFEPGQWFRGSVYPERSDLSPDGAWLLVFMGNFRRPYFTWTVLSRPPWFTAVALWPKGDTWGGGGVFVGKGGIVLRHGDGQAAPTFGAVPKRFDFPLPDPNGQVARELAADPHGWRPLCYGSGPFRRQEGAATLTLSFEKATRSWDTKRVYGLTVGRRTILVPDAQWADLDRNGDLLFAVGGTLHRLRAAAAAELEDGADATLSSRMLADFTDLRFQAIRAPYEGVRQAGPGAHAAETDGYAPPLDRVGKEDRRARRLACRKAAQ